MVELNFALGLPRLKSFHNMIAALDKNDFITAAREILNSVWATEVHQRANDIAYRIEHGEYPAT